MSAALLVLPDFLIIIFGWLLNRKLGFSREFFASLEKLIYYVLFPALLFQSIVRVPISLSTAAELFFATAAVAACGIALSWLAWPILRAPSFTMASLAQCGYRFNTYIALALAPGLAGASGQAVMALIVGFAVPIVNLAAIYALARNQGVGFVGALLRNPLLVSTVLGLLFNLAGLQLPQFIDILFGKLGVAAIALGILCVGASLTWEPGQTNFKLIAWMLTIKLVVLPICAWLICDRFALNALERQMLILFATMPPATAAYVLTVRMGGDARAVSLLISIGTPLSALTLPIWLSLIS